MFQEYCEAHGRPVVEDSLYCSEECRMLDEHSSVPQLPLESYQEEPFLYECLVCLHPHGPSSPCNTAYSYGEDPEPMLILESLSYVPKTYNPIQHNSPNELLLMANYQKWLSTVRG